MDFPLSSYSGATVFSIWSRLSISLFDRDISEIHLNVADSRLFVFIDGA